MRKTKHNNNKMIYDVAPQISNYRIILCLYLFINIGLKTFTAEYKKKDIAKIITKK